MVVIDIWFVSLLLWDRQICDTFLFYVVIQTEFVLEAALYSRLNVAIQKSDPME